MAAGDVAVVVVNNPTAASVDTAVTGARAAGGANGKISVFGLDGSVWIVSIEEA